MQTHTAFRAAAIAWLATAIARIGVGVLGAGPAGGGVAPLTLGLGAVLGLAVAAWLWLRPGRSSAFGAILLGFYAVAGIAYAPLIGLQPWFIVFAGTGLVAFALSIVAYLTTRRSRLDPDA